MTLAETFNHREIAFGIWIGVALALALSNSGTRRSLGGVVRAFCQTQLLVPLGLMLAWITLAVYGLESIGYWNAGLLKNTVIWTVTVAAVSFFRLPSIAEDPHYFKQAIKDNLKLIIVLEFIISSYTFGLVLELAIVPASALIGGMLAIAGTDRKYRQVETFLNGIVAALSVALLINALLALSSDSDGFAMAETLADFLLPIILSLLLLPFLYAMTVFLNYQLAFTRLKVFMADADLRSYARRMAIRRFRLDSGLARRWAHDLVSLGRQSNAEIDASIELLSAMRAAERNPPPVPASDGWSPYEAKNFLASEGIQTGHYHPVGGQDWSASSPYKEFGGGILPNNLAYYVEGDRGVASALRLVLNINEPDSSADARERLRKAADILHQAALGTPIPAKAAKAIDAGRPASFTTGGHGLTVTKEEWGDRQRRYSLAVAIRK